MKWADRQYKLNGHILNKIVNGATRNIVIHSAIEKGLTETMTRDDMEHIHNLTIIDIVFRAGDAYVSTNSIHNALFARTCMMSRSAYKGCKIEFFQDECDVPLPPSRQPVRMPIADTLRKKPQITNRFDMLNMDGSDGNSDQENRTPSETASDEQTVDMDQNVGVSLRFLDSDSV